MTHNRSMGRSAEDSVPVEPRKAEYGTRVLYAVRPGRSIVDRRTGEVLLRAGDKVARLADVDPGQHDKLMVVGEEPTG